MYLKWRQPYKSTSGVEAIIPTLREAEMGEWRGQPGYTVKPSWGEGKKKGRRRRRGEERMGEGERKRKREKVFFLLKIEHLFLTDQSVKFSSLV